MLFLKTFKLLQYLSSEGRLFHKNWCIRSWSILNKFFIQTIWYFSPNVLLNGDKCVPLPRLRIQLLLKGLSRSLYIRAGIVLSHKKLLCWDVYVRHKTVVFGVENSLVAQMSVFRPKNVHSFFGFDIPKFILASACTRARLFKARLVQVLG